MRKALDQTFEKLAASRYQMEKNPTLQQAWVTKNPDIMSYFSRIEDLMVRLEQPAVLAGLIMSEFLVGADAPNLIQNSCIKNSKFKIIILNS